MNNLTVDSTLLARLREDCETFGRTLVTMPLNERHLQVMLYDFLKSQPKHYDQIFLEYSVPFSVLTGYRKNEIDGMMFHDNKSFPWMNDLSIDLVVEKDNRYAAVELKYSTCKIKDTEISIFGNREVQVEDIIKTKGAYDITCYNFWKDVRRIEQFRARFQFLEGGVAFMMSNAASLWSKPSAGTALANFSMCGNIIQTGVMEWPETFSQKVAMSNPPFRLDGTYSLTWNDTGIKERAKSKNAPFRFTMAVVTRPSTEKFKDLRTK